jgi:hypothetical protein
LYSAVEIAFAPVVRVTYPPDRHGRATLLSLIPGPSPSGGEGRRFVRRGLEVLELAARAVKVTRGVGLVALDLAEVDFLGEVAAKTALRRQSSRAARELSKRRNR